jgi:phosphoserine aminotransferase
MRLARGEVAAPRRRCGDCAVSERKAAKLCARSIGQGSTTANVASRSLMNVTFRLPTEEREKAFVRESTAAGFDGLKGHRAVGGMRASIYNAFPEAGIDALVSFMRDFERTHG